MQTLRIYAPSLLTGLLAGLEWIRTILGSSDRRVEIEPGSVTIILIALFPFTAAISTSLWQNRSALPLLRKDNPALPVRYWLAGTAASLITGIALWLNYTYLNSAGALHYLLLWFSAGFGFFIMSPFLALNRQAEQKNSDFLLLTGLFAVRFAILLLALAVVYISLAYGIVILEDLFGLDISEKTYIVLWIALACFLAPYLMLQPAATVYPEGREQPEETGHIKGIRILTGFAVLPLTLYSGVIIVYAVFVLFSEESPRSLLALLTIMFALPGIPVWFLNQSARPQAGIFGWIRSLLQIMIPVAMIPAMLLLFHSAYLRIGQYGITPDRYVLILCTAIMAAFLVQAAQILISRYIKDSRPQYMLFPLMFLLLLLVGSAGPLSSGEVSYRSQRDRFVKLSEEIKLIENGKLQVKELYADQVGTIISVLEYMNKTNNWERFSSGLGLENPPQNRLAFLKSLKVNTDSLQFRRTAKSTGRPPLHGLDVSSYRTVLFIHFYGLNESSKTEVLKFGKQSYTVTLDPVKAVLSVESDSKVQVIKLRNTESLIFESENNKARFITGSMGYYEDESGNMAEIYNLEGYLLLK